MLALRSGATRPGDFRQGARAARTTRSEGWTDEPSGICQIFPKSPKIGSNGIVSSDQDHVSDLLARLDRGDSSAADDLFQALYSGLRAIAGREMGQERADHTLQPTALVHEAWIRLFGTTQAPDSFRDRQHVLRVVARTMRRILVDHARARRTEKRGGGEATNIEIEGLVQAYEDQGTDLVELDDALATLSETDEELVRVIELKTFGGLSMGEIADALGVSKATAERRWQVARLWLMRALGADEL